MQTKVDDSSSYAGATEEELELSKGSLRRRLTNLLPYVRATYQTYALTSNLQHPTSNSAWDAAGNRITFQSSTRVNDADTYTFVYDITAGIPAVIEETTPTGTNRYIREPGGELIARVSTVGTTEITSYYHFDQLGSTQFLTDTNGVITDKYTYDAWGNLTSHTGTTQQPYQYVGKYGYYAHTQDANLKMMQLGVRLYDSRLGRFVQRDPVQDGINAYTYVAVNPVNRIDPTGLYYAGIITAKMCRDKCAASGYMPGLCKTACKLLKNCTCTSLQAAIEHEIRHCRQKIADALIAVFFAVDCKYTDSNYF